MQNRFCYAPHAWLNYWRIIIFDFTFFEIVGIFLILYNFPIKILRRDKILILPLSGIFATVLESLKSFQKSFFHFIKAFEIMQLLKRRETVFRFSFLTLFLRSFIYGENAYMSQIVNDSENKIKLETIFLAFRNALI